MSEVPLPPPGRLGERPGTPSPEGLRARREAAAAALARHPEAECRLGEAPGIRCLRFNPGGAARGTVMHWHGGGFRLGSPEYAATFARALASACDVEVICPEYRLAPEHPYPAGLNDGVAAIEGALALGVGRLILSGDSAGGGLAASLAGLCANRGIPLAGLILLSPWLDLSLGAESFVSCADTDPLFSLGSATEAAAQYLQGHPATDPLASPLALSPARFPPAYVSVGEGEVLRDDSVALHRRLTDAGRRAQLTLVPGMEHVAVMRDSGATGSQQVFAEVCDFVGSAVSG